MQKQLKSCSEETYQVITVLEVQWLLDYKTNVQHGNILDETFVSISSNAPDSNAKHSHLNLPPSMPNKQIPADVTASRIRPF